MKLFWIASCSKLMVNSQTIPFFMVTLVIHTGFSQRFQKLIYLHLITDCLMKISPQSSELIQPDEYNHIGFYSSFNICLVVNYSIIQALFMNTFKFLQWILKYLCKKISVNSIATRAVSWLIFYLIISILMQLHWLNYTELALFVMF